MTPLVYVAGPYRARSWWDRERNIQAARSWGVRIARGGAYPIIPHSNTSHLDDEAPESLWLEGTLELMRRCDAVLLAPGWSKSVGARAERTEAKRLKIPLYDTTAVALDVVEDSLAEWIVLLRRHGPRGAA